MRQKLRYNINVDPKNILQFKKKFFIIFIRMSNVCQIGHPATKS